METRTPVTKRKVPRGFTDGEEEPGVDYTDLSIPTDKLLKMLYELQASSQFVLLFDARLGTEVLDIVASLKEDGWIVVDDENLLTDWVMYYTMKIRHIAFTYMEDFYYALADQMNFDEVVARMIVYSPVNLEMKCIDILKNRPTTINIKTTRPDGLKGTNCRILVDGKQVYPQDPTKLGLN